MLRHSVSKYGYYLVIPIVILLGISIVSTSTSWIEPTEFGMASVLPLTYWIGLFLLGCFWYIGKDSRYCLIAALVLTVSYLYVAPAVIRVTPWISNSYYPFGEALLINSSGHLVYHSSAIFVSYIEWPIFLYFASAFTLITGIPHEILLKYFPLLIISLYGLFSVLILRTKLSLSYSLFGAAWVLGSFFIRQQYFGPQAIAYVFFLMILLFASWLFFEDKANKTLIALLLFLCIVTTATHQLTSLMSIFMMFALYITYRLVSKKSSKVISGFCLLSAVVWLGYNMYLAPGFFNTTVRHMANILFGERDLGLYSEPSRIIGSEPMLVNFAASWSIVFLGATISIISIFLIIKSRRKRTKSSQIDFSFFMVILLIMFGLFAIGGEYGAHEAYQRAFMFALIPISYLCISLLARKPKLLVLCLVGILFLNIPAQYGGDTYRLATKTQLAGSAFIAENSHQNISLIGKFSLYIRYSDPLKDVKVLSTGLSFPFTTYNSSAINKAISEVLDEADYIMLSDLQENYYLFFLGLDPIEQANLDDKCNRIYDNGRFRALKPLP